MFLLKADIGIADGALAGLRAADDRDLGIDAVLLESVRAAYDLGEGAFGKLATGGTFHRLYTTPDDARLARIAAFAAQPWTGLMEMECRLAAELDARGLAVPACEFRVLREGGRERGVQLVERVAGEPAKASDDDEATARVHLAAIAAFLRDLHRIEGTGFGPLASVGARSGTAAGHAFTGLLDRWSEFAVLRLDEHLRTCTDIGALPAPDAARIATTFEAARDLLDRGAAPRLLHGDPGSHNFIMGGERLAGVIDWEDALLGDPLFDVAGLCTFHPVRRHAHILESYGAVPVRGSEAWRRFWLYFLRIAIARTVHRHRFGYSDVPGRPAAASRIGIALDELSAERE